VIPLLARSALRHALGHPWQLALSVLGVALGVAVVVGIDLASDSANRAFALSTEAITGRTTHQVFGGPAGLPDEAYRALVVEAGVRPAAPVVEGFAAVPGRAGTTLRVLGIDLFAEPPFRAYLAFGTGPAARGASPPDLSAWLTRDGAVALSPSTARALGLAPGGTLEIETGGTRRTLVLAGLIEPGDELARRALEGLVLADVATAQELLGLTGRLTRIDLIVPDGAAGEAALARARAALPPGATLVRAAARTASMQSMTGAFRLNLAALSLLALVCGAFLIYNAMTFSVVQRRPQIGRLRALGVTRREILGSVLGEAAGIGLAGTALGLLLGIVLGRGLVVLVTQTINDLYFVLTVREAIVSPGPLLKGAALGLAGTLLAALAPALEATAVPPVTVLSRSAVETRLRRGLPALTGAALGLLALAALLLAIPTRSLPVAFGGVFAVILGCALLTPAVVLLAARALARPATRLFGILGGMAARGVAAGLSRTGVATAALMIAISVAVGVGVMIASFRQTVIRWLDYSLAPDVYVTAPSTIGSRSETPLDPALVAALRDAPGVAAAHTLRGTELETADGPLRVVAIAMTERGHRAFSFKEGRPEAIWPAFERGGAVIVSEPFAFRRGIGAGGTVTLPTDRGPRDFPVAGVFYDYGSDQGAVMMARATWDAAFDDRGVNALGLFAAAGQDPDALAEALRARVPAGQEVVIQSQRAIKRISLEIFDRTFMITAVLRFLAFVVAFVAVLSALMALQLEKSRELGVLRANGLTPGQVFQLVAAETGILGVVAGLLALPVGLVLAALMIFVINRRSFGWSLSMAVDPWLLAQAFGVAVLAALLAGLYPALRMARTSPAVALREE
jgi:putative ABC transport system permease protein